MAAHQQTLRSNAAAVEKTRGNKAEKAFSPKGCAIDDKMTIFSMPDDLQMTFDDCFSSKLTTKITNLCGCPQLCAA